MNYFSFIFPYIIVSVTLQEKSNLNKVCLVRKNHHGPLVSYVEPKTVRSYHFGTF